MKDKREKYIPWIDMARSIAILCVVWCHVVEEVYHFNLEYVSQLPLSAKIFSFSAFTIGRLGVPIFLFITGYLLLGKEYNKEKCKVFWKHNLLSLFITVEIWIVLYHIFLTLYYQNDFDFSILLETMLFIRPVNISHMWYMPMILGCYLFIPVVSNGLIKNNKEACLLPLLAAGIQLFIFPIISMLSHVFYGKDISSLISIEFCGCYAYMIIMGYLVKYGIFKKIHNKFLILIQIGMFLCAVIFQIFLYQKQFPYNIWYNCGFLFLSALALFELFSRIKIKKFYNFFYSTARCSFGVYLLHNPIKMLLIHCRWIQVIEILWVKVIVLFLITFLIAWGGTLILSKISKLGKILFLIK